MLSTSASEQAETQQRVLFNEFNHRVKNNTCFAREVQMSCM